MTSADMQQNLSTVRTVALGGAHSLLRTDCARPFTDVFLLTSIMFGTRRFLTIWLQEVMAAIDTALNKDLLCSAEGSRD